MNTYHKLMFATLAAMLALSLGASTAVALRSLELRPAGAIAATARGLLFTEPGGLPISSNVTLTGRLETRIAKRSRARVGQIERCAANEGRDAAGLEIEATIRCELNMPWPITYVSIKGTLPRIVSFLVIVERASFLLKLVRERIIPLNECLYQGNIGADTNAPPITTLTVQPGSNIANLVADLEHQNQACAANGTLTVTFTITRQEVRLV